MAQSFTPDKLIFGLKAAADPQLSPDGERIVYVVATPDPETKKGTAHLWLSNRDGSEKRQLTTAGRGNSMPKWSPDGKQIAFISDRTAEADAKKGTGIYLLGFEGGDPRLLTRHPGTVGDLEWSSDGKYLAYSAVVDPLNPEGEEPKEGEPAPIKVTDRIDYKQDTRGYLADTRGQVFILDVVSGERRQLTDDRDDHLHPRWSPDGKTIAAIHPHPNFVKSQVELIDVATGAIRRVMPTDGVIGTWTWSRDGTKLAVGSDLDWGFQQEISLVDIATGEHRQVTTDLQVTPSGSWSVMRAPAHPVWLDDNRALYQIYAHGRSGLAAIDVETGEVAEEVRWDGSHYGFSTDVSGRYVTQTRNGFDGVGEVVVYDRQAGELAQITTLNTETLSETKPAQAENFSIERNGFTIEAWLLKPGDFDPSKRYPLVIDIHGGPNGWYGPSFSGVQQLLASNGFVVVFANPRGSGSYGREFTAQVQRDWGGEDYQDLMAVVDAAIERPYVDSERTGVYGYSYGGFMTSWVIGHTNRFKAAVIGAPVVDLISFFGTSDIGHVWGPIQYGGKPWEAREWYLAHSPITYLHEATTPTLILHAEGDIRCPIGQGEQLFATLKSVGVEAEFVRYPGGDHLFAWGGEPTYQADFLTRILAWFQKHLT